VKTGKIIWDGLAKQNPTFRMALGLCPTLAVTTALTNGLVMGIAVTFVLACSNVLVSLLRKIIPDKVRIPAFIVIIATFVTIADMLLEGFVPDIHKTLGIFIPLIVVNCIILGRAESFASKNPVFSSLVDGIFMGLGFTLSLSLISVIREVLGTGKLIFFGNLLFSFDFSVLGFVLAPGAFLTLGLLLSLFNYIDLKRGTRQ